MLYDSSHVRWSYCQGRSNRHFGFEYKGFQQRHQSKIVVTVRLVALSRKHSPRGKRNRKGTYSVSRFPEILKSRKLKASELILSCCTFSVKTLKFCRKRHIQWFRYAFDEWQIMLPGKQNVKEEKCGNSP